MSATDTNINPDANFHEDFTKTAESAVVEQAQAFRNEDAVSDQQDKFVASVEKLNSYIDKTKEVEDRDGQQRLEGFQKKLSMVGGAVSALAASSKELQEAIQPIASALQVVNGAIMMWLQSSQAKNASADMLKKIEHAIDNTRVEMNQLSQGLKGMGINPENLVSGKLLKDVGFESSEAQNDPTGDQSGNETRTANNHAIIRPAGAFS